jgi:hypothetical protein
LKNQSNPPHGKPHSIIRVAGIFREKKVLHPLFRFCVGIILSKSHLDFIVSVPVNVFLLKYRAKRVKMMRFYRITDENSAFCKRNAPKRMIFTKSDAYSI